MQRDDGALLVMTPSEIASYLREYMDLTSQDVSDALVLRWANEGQRQVLKSRARWAHLEARHQFATVDGIDTYDIGASIKNVTAVDSPSVGPLVVVDEAEANARYWQNGSTATGAPKVLSRWGVGQVRVWPLPDDTYVIDVLGQRPAVTMTMTAAADLPEDLTDCVVEWCMQRAYMHQDDPEMAAMHRQLFDQELSVFASREDDDSSEPIVFAGGFAGNSRARRVRPDVWTPTFGDLGDDYGVV